MFRSTTIIRELVLNLAKVIFIAVCVLNAVHTTQTHLSDMLPHHQITYNDIILPSVLTQIEL